jgi:predicted metal-dependent hydrolase
MIRAAMSFRAASTAAFMGITSQLGLWDAHVADQPWCVRESARARRLTARVFHDGRVEIVVPAGTRQRTVADFVARQRPWIERARLKAARRAAVAPLIVTEFPPATLRLAALNEDWSVTPQQGDGASPEQLREDLREQLRLRAQAGFLPQLTVLAAQMSVDFSRLQLRWQRSRWGSCSRLGTISLNACLLFQRPEVVRYLMVHELAHRHHMNHGAAFWRRVAQHEPDRRALDRELARGWQNVPRWILNAAAVNQAGT